MTKGTFQKQAMIPYMKQFGKYFQLVTVVLSESEQVSL